MIISLIGPPASGKGTQARRLVDGYGFQVLSISGKIKQEMDEDPAFNARIAAFTAANPGALVPDELINDKLPKWIDDIYAEHGEQADILLDGYPRTLDQAVFLETMLDDKHRILDAVICLDFTAEETEELVRRQINRAQEALANGQTPRADDLDEAVARKRVDIFWEQTWEAVEFFDDQGLTEHVKGSDTIDQVYGQIDAVLQDIQALKDDGDYAARPVAEHIWPAPNIWGGLKL